MIDDRSDEQEYIGLWMSPIDMKCVCEMPHRNPPANQNISFNANGQSSVRYDRGHLATWFLIWCWFKIWNQLVLFDNIRNIKQKNKESRKIVDKRNCNYILEIPQLTLEKGGECRLQIENKISSCQIFRKCSLGYITTAFFYTFWRYIMWSHDLDKIPRCER